MARPQKQTVKYFPHDTDASDGKTLTIIQSKYGNDGYSFWFKLLQLLGKSPGQYYDFKKPADWEFLLAKTHQSDPEKAKDILETLVVLDAIDAELYANGFIWCQKFVDRVTDAYGRTVAGAPQRPGFLVNVGDKGVSVNRLDFEGSGDKPPEPEVANLNDQNAHQKGNDIKGQKGVNVESSRVSVLKSGQSTNRNSENATENPQSKVNETKVNETKEDAPVASFIAYKEELRAIFPELDIDVEWERCQIWYRDHEKAIKSPSLALGSWCGKEREIRAERHGKDRRYTGERSRKTTDEQRLASLSPEQRRQQTLDE